MTRFGTYGYLSTMLAAQMTFANAAAADSQTRLPLPSKKATLVQKRKLERKAP